MKFKKFDGNNWEDILFFLEERGEYIKKYNDGEIISFIYIPELDHNMVPGDVIYKDSLCFEIFTEKQWKYFNRPDFIIEFERLMNILMGKLNEFTEIRTIIEEITNGSLVSKMVKTEKNMLLYLINDTLCEIIRTCEKNDNGVVEKFEVFLVND